jgi:hypothetical protein
MVRRAARGVDCFLILWCDVALIGIQSENKMSHTKTSNNSLSASQLQHITQQPAARITLCQGVTNATFIAGRAEEALSAAIAEHSQQGVK